MDNSKPHPDKAALRKAVLARRAAMTPEARAAASRRIVERLVTLPEFTAAEGVHCFVSLAEEVDTEPVFRACWEAGKRTFIPYQIPARGVLGLARREPEDKLIAGPFNVPEPPPHRREEEPRGEVDLVLVPGVAFDRAGHRLGYGKGFYDDFLTSIARGGVKDEWKVRRSSGVAVIALVFAVQIVDSVPADPWDVTLPAILTEEELIREA
jgi:5-formyltetrahydrofolate cyclo-ligase